MAKRKKHRKKKQAKQVAARNNQSNKAAATGEHEPAQEVTTEKLPAAKVEIAEAGSAQEAKFVKHDVRYSLILIGSIAIVFIVLYFLLQNPTVSAHVYSIIKLPNVGL